MTCKSDMNLEFSNDQLNQVSFTIYLEKDAKGMDSKEVDELNSLYGDVETTGLDNRLTSGVGTRIPFYKWWFFKNDEQATVI